MSRDPWAYSETERSPNEYIRRIGRGINSERSQGRIGPSEGLDTYVKEPARQTARDAARRAGGYRKSRKRSPTRK